MDAYYVTPVTPVVAGPGAVFSTFTAKQDVSPQPLPLIRGGSLHVGSKISIEANGEYSSLTNAVLTLGLYIGTVGGNITTDIALGPANTVGTTPAAWPWRLAWTGVVTALGVTGSVTGQGWLDFGSSLTASTRSPIPLTAALRTFTWDTTIDRAVGVSGTYGASSASNQVKTNLHSVLLLN